MPDNYRYLPGYTGDRETEQAWRAGDARYTQIDWDELIAQNRHGGGPCRLCPRRPRRAARRPELQRPVYDCARRPADTALRLVLRHARSRNYKQMRDLLGAEYITDIDQYLVDDDTYSNLLQNDLRRPGRTIRKGGRFGYDYALTTRRADARLHAEYRLRPLPRRSRPFAGRRRSLPPRVLREGAFPRRASYGRSRRCGLRPIPSGRPPAGLLAPQLPRSVGRRRSRAARRRGPFLPAAVQQPRHRRSPSRTPLCRRNQLQPYGAKR